MIYAQPPGAARLSPRASNSPGGPDQHFRAAGVYRSADGPDHDFGDSQNSGGETGSAEVSFTNMPAAILGRFSWRAPAPRWERSALACSPQVANGDLRTGHHQRRHERNDEAGAGTDLPAGSAARHLRSRWLRLSAGRGERRAPGSRAQDFNGGRIYSHPTIGPSPSRRCSSTLSTSGAAKRPPASPSPSRPAPPARCRPGCSSGSPGPSHPDPRPFNAGDPRHATPAVDRAPVLGPVRWRPRVRSTRISRAPYLGPCSVDEPVTTAAPIADAADRSATAPPIRSGRRNGRPSSATMSAPRCSGSPGSHYCERRQPIHS